MKKTLLIFTAITLLTCNLCGCTMANTIVKPQNQLSGQYTVTATIEPTPDTFYYIGIQYVDEDNMAGMISSKDAKGDEVTISIMAKNGCSNCDVYDKTGSFSYFCDGNILTNESLNIIHGETIFNTLNSMLSNVVYEEDCVSPDRGPCIHMISNYNSVATDMVCVKDAEGKITSVDTRCTFNDYPFNVSYYSDFEIGKMDVSQSEKIDRDELLNTINTMANYMFSTTVQQEFSAKLPDLSAQEEEPVETPAPTPTPEPEPEDFIAREEIATLSDAKDLFIKLSFSNTIEDVEFISPTGGSYKVASGSVEYMQDNENTKDAYYRIPNAEIGTWTLVYNKSNNEITYETVTDNKIKIGKMDLSPVKDGIITVTPSLVMDKGLDINYEYTIDVLQGNETVQSSNNILNTKSDKAKYNVSVMNLEPGTYKIRLRLEYMYDGQHYINIFSSKEFTVD